MVTSYNVGDIVLLKGKVKSIAVNSTGTTYSIELPNKHTPVVYDEKDVYDVVVVVDGENGKQ